jgi:hypothetical protein
MGACEMTGDELAVLDGDSDGMRDTWEALWDVDDPEGDPDGDGAANLEEYLADTNPVLAAGMVWYVDTENTTGPWDGGTWSTAFQTIQEAVDAALTADGGDVWVAEGGYTSTGGNVVTLAEGVNLYGGFSSTETCRGDRDCFAHETIIDGEGMRRCVYAEGVENATLDGFIVTRGLEDLGGGMHNDFSTPVITHCVFLDNRATTHGGGMYNVHSSPVLTNCVFHANTARLHGGGLYNQSWSPLLINCTVADNMAAFGGGIYNTREAFPLVLNSIVWGNGPDGIQQDLGGFAILVFSFLQSAHPGSGNVYGDPLFVDPANGDFRLEAGSPCIDHALSWNAPPTDVTGVLRPQGAGFDLGAYEYFIDVDADGMADDWEIVHGLDPAVDDAYEDPDADGLTNVEEFLAGTDPLLPALTGDVNHNGILDAADLQLVVNAVLGLDIAPYNADVDGDGRLTAADIQTVINAFLQTL